MASVYNLAGGWISSAASGTQSGVPQVNAQLNETVVLIRQLEVEYDLSSDSIQAIAFGGLTNVNVFNLVADQKVAVRFTSADGATKVIPVDGTICLISQSVPFTAIDVQRVAGKATNVKIFMGERA